MLFRSCDEYETVTLLREHGERWAAEPYNARIVPLYATPEPALTSRERKAICEAITGYSNWMQDNNALQKPNVQEDLEALRNLLERLA